MSILSQNIPTKIELKLWAEIYGNNAYLSICYTLKQYSYNYGHCGTVINKNKRHESYITVF